MSEPGGGATPPDFGRSVNPISTRAGVGADYAHQIILAPLDFQTFLRPCIHMYNFLLINGQILAYIQIPNIKCKFKLGNLKEAEEQTKITGLRLPSASFLPKKRIQLTVLEIKSSKKPHISTKPL